MRRSDRVHAKVAGERLTLYDDRNMMTPDSRYPDAPRREPLPRRAEFTPPNLPPGTPAVYLRSVSFDTFIFRNMVAKVEGHPEGGDIVAVIDRRGELFGWGFFHPRSMITLRMITHSPQRPPESFVADRIKQAVQLRRDVLKLDATADAYRLIHAEGDGISGLIADKFGDYVVIELFSLAMFRRIHQIEDAFVDAGLRVKAFIHRADKSTMDFEGFTLPKAPRHDPSVVITENGVRFKVDLEHGHKTGFFCDQRENRLALTAFTPGRNVLDCCCYTGGFACYAATVGKAAAVTAVDLDEVALETAKENGKLNRAKIEFRHGDAFEFLRTAQRKGTQWDVVVLDPSKFVPNREAMEIGLKKYADLNRLALDVLSPGGMLLTCSCSGLVDQPTFVETIGRSVRAAGRTMKIIRITGAGPDHPFQPETPEAAYLKAVWARVE